MKKILLILSVSIIMVVSACSGGGGGEFTPDKFSRHDMAIIKVSTDEKVKYGMSRSGTEKILGKGEANRMGDVLQYANGVVVYYRDDYIACIALIDGSQGFFKTARGAEVGMLRSDLLTMYGEKNLITNKPTSAEIAYNTKKKEFISRSRFKSEEVVQDTYVASFAFDVNEYTTSIMLLDGRFGVMK